MRRYDAYYVVLRRRRWPMIGAAVAGVAAFVVTLAAGLALVLALLFGALAAGLVYRAAGRGLMR